MFKSTKEIVGMAIDAGQDTVVTWYQDGTVSKGRSYLLDSDMTCHTYTLPSGMSPFDVVGISIAANHQVYVWYRNGTWSVGHSTHLDRYSNLQPFELPLGKSTDEIVDMAIAKSTDKVYTWYRDGTLSIGDHGDLDLYKAPYPYGVPSGRSTSDIVGIDLTTTDTVVAWYRGVKFSGDNQRPDSKRRPVHFLNEAIDMEN
jgi:hypothetical protein